MPVKKKTKQKQKQKQKQEQKVIVNIGKEVFRRTRRKRSSKPTQATQPAIAPRELPPIVFQTPPTTILQPVAPLQPVAQPVQQVGRPPILEDIGITKGQAEILEPQKFPEDEAVPLVSEEKKIRKERKKETEPRKAYKTKGTIEASVIPESQALQVAEAVPFEDVAIKAGGFDLSESPSPFQQERQPDIQDIFNSFRGEPSGKVGETMFIKVKTDKRRKQYIDRIIQFTGEPASNYENVKSSKLKDLLNKMEEETRSPLDIALKEVKTEGSVAKKKKGGLIIEED